MGRLSPSAFIRDPNSNSTRNIRHLTTEQILLSIQEVQPFPFIYESVKRQLIFMDPCHTRCKGHQASNCSGHKLIVHCFSPHNFSFSLFFSSHNFSFKFLKHQMDEKFSKLVIAENDNLQRVDRKQKQKQKQDKNKLKLIIEWSLNHIRIGQRR